MATFTAAAAETSTLPDITISVRQVFGLDSEMQVPGFSQKSEHVPDVDESYRFDHDTTMAILAGFAYNRRVMIQGYHGTGKSTHIEQVRGAPQLALHPRQSRFPHQPHRSDRQGRDRPARRQAGDGVSRGPAALGAAAPDRSGVRRIRRRPAGRDVRDPARAGGRGQADAARPEPRHPPASGVPPVLHLEHGRPRRHHRPLSRHAADQPGPDGPLEHRGDAELPAARGRGRHRAVEVAELRQRGGPQDHQGDGVAAPS